MSLISSLVMTRLTVACVQAFTREENAPLYNLYREEGVARVEVEEVDEKEGD